MRFFESVHGVYFDDLDPFQILHNARYVLLFERTIGAFWEELGFAGPLDRTRDSDQAQLVRANHIEYHRPVVGLGRVRIRIWIEKLGRTSLTFGFRMSPLDEDVDYATGSRVVVKVDSDTRPAPWTDAFRLRVAPYRKDVPH
jgi:acyl-CoA thioester hydrolase